MKKSVCLLLILLVAAVFSGCKKEKEILFDDAIPLSLAPDVEWALVVDPYAAYYKEPDWNSEVLNHCRKGDILRIEGKALKKGGKELWLDFSYGWLTASAVEIYSNRLKAVTAASNLK